MQTLFIIISSALILVNPIIYARAMFKGRAKPHRTTLFVLATITLISAVALYAQGDKVAIYLAAAQSLQSIFLFILSIKLGMGGWERTDIACLLIAVVGIILWKSTDNPLLGLYFSIIADFAGTIPTIIKTIRYPQTEILSYFLIDVFAALLSVFALNSLAIAESLYPVYILLINLLLTFIMIFPRKSKGTE